jgi:predicted transcriptional regulator
LSQDRLGEHTAVHDTHVSSIKRGEVQPTLCAVVRKLTALDVSADELVGGISDAPVHAQ